MYAATTPHILERTQTTWQAAGGSAVREAVWRARWALFGIVAIGLLGLGYARLAASQAPTHSGPSQVVTVAPGDTLWAIAERRYPGADPREKVYEIERLNNLSSPVIEVGQRLEVPSS